VYTSATFGPTFNAIYLAFDADTNLAGLAPNQIVPCDSLVVLSGPQGGNASCTFTSASTLVVLLPPDSLFPFTGNASLVPGPILSRFAAHSSSAQGSHQVMPSSAVPMPAVQIIGVNSFGHCSTPTALSAVGTGSGGRALTFAWNDSLGNALTSPTWPISYNASLNGAVTYTVTATNWMGSSATAPPFTVVYTSGVSLDVQLSAPAVLQMLASSKLAVKASASLPLECNISSPTFAYSWTLTTDALVDRTSLLASNTSATAYAAALPPGQYVLTVTVTASSALSGVVTGGARTSLTVIAADMVAILPSGSQLSLQEGSVLVLDASASCDPNLASPVCGRLGALAGGDPATIDVSWTCTTALDTPCTVADVSCAPACLAGSTPVLHADNLTAANAPYTFQAHVASATGSGAAPVNTALVLVTVNPKSATCLLPDVAIAPLPQRITGETDASALLVIAAAASASPPGLVLQWSTDSVADIAALLNGRASDQANLVLSAALLGAGQMFAFMLTATVPCSPYSSFAQVSFVVNSAPLGGQLAVSPTTGMVATTFFALQASTFEDPEGDLPLSFAFEAAYEAGVYSPLCDFSLSPQLSALLQTNATGGSAVTLVALATDALGARSGRQATLGVTVNPVASGSFDAQSVLDQVASTGGSASDTLLAIAALASATEAAPDADPTWVASVQAALTNTLGALLDAPPAPDNSPLVSAQQLSVLVTLVRASEQGAPSTDFALQAGGFANTIVQNAQASVLSATLGGKDPQAQSAVPSTIGPQSLSTLGSCLSMLQSALTDANRRSRFLASADPTDPAGVRTTLRQLVDLVMTGAVVGSPQQNIPGVQIQLGVLRETAGALGLSSAAFVDLPAVDSGDPPTRFILPPNVLADDVDASTELTVVVARFNVNTNELLKPGAVANLSADPNAPVSNVTSFVVLEFQLNSTAVVHPHDLVSRIDIVIPFQQAPDLNPALVAAGGGNYSAGGNESLACGFWNVTTLGWSSGGCYATNLTLPDVSVGSWGSLTCSCDHASDYAVWQSWEESLTVVATSFDLSVVTEIVVLVVAVLLPSLLISWVVAVVWARVRDKRDSDMLHRGAITLFVANKARARLRARHFFVLLRNGQRANYQHAPHRAERIRSVAARAFFGVRYVARAIYYESSLFGVGSRFDPAFERPQRVSVFAGVLLGNLFAASFFFSLETGSDITIDVIIVRILLCALAVALPLKVGIRLVFRMTAARAGSKMNRANHLLRMLEHEGDIRPWAHTSAEQADLDLLACFKDLYLAKMHVAVLRKDPHAILPPGKYRAMRFLHTSTASSTRGGQSAAPSAGARSSRQPQKHVSATSGGGGGGGGSTPRSHASSPHRSVKHTSRRAMKELDLDAGADNDDVDDDEEKQASPASSLRRSFRSLRVRSKKTKKPAAATDGDIVSVDDLYAHNVRGNEDDDARTLSFAGEEEFDDEEAPSPRKLARHQSNKTGSNTLSKGSGSGVLSEPRSTPKSGRFPSSRKHVPDMRHELVSHAVGGTDFVETFDVTSGAFEVFLPGEMRDADTGEAANPVMGSLVEELRDNQAHMSMKLANLANLPGLSDSPQSTAPRKHPVGYIGDWPAGTLAAPMSREKALVLAEIEVDRAKAKLRAAAFKSETEWRSLEALASRPSRATRMRAQHTIALKMAALLGDEARPVPREAKKRCVADFVVVAWLLLFLYYAGCLAWVTLWLFTRDNQTRINFSQLDPPVDNPTQAQVAAGTNAILTFWLMTALVGVAVAYFVVEPALIVLRNVLLPALVNSCGVSERAAVKVAQGKMAGSTQPSLMLRALNGFFNLLAEFIDAVT